MLCSSPSAINIHDVFCGNAAVSCEKALPHLWSYPTRMGINVDVAWLKCASLVRTSPRKIPHLKTKKKYYIDSVFCPVILIHYLEGSEAGI